MLIEQGDDIEAKDKNDRTPLHVAAESNSLDVATLLIDLGADIEANNEHGETPLHLAAWCQLCLHMPTGNLNFNYKYRYYSCENLIKKISCVL